MSPEFLLQILMAVAAGAGVYAAIRADLTRAIVLAERAAEVADSAHERITHHVEVHHTT